MIRLVKRDEIDDRLWNECIKGSPEGQAFYYTWYLDACCQNWVALILDNYDAVFPLAFRSKFGFMYLYQPFFTRHFGVISKMGSDANLRSLFLESIPEDFKYIDFCVHSFHHEIPQVFNTREKIFQELKLSHDYSDIQKRYTDNLNRNLKKAEKAKLRLLTEFSPELVVEMFRSNQKEKLEEFSDSDYQVLKKLMHAAITSTKTICWGIQNENGEIQSGAFFIQTGKRILYLKGFSTPSGKKNGAMHFLFDNLIHSFAGQDLTLDFGGSSILSVARFYKNFGSDDCLYLQLRANRLPKVVRWLKR